MKDIKLQWCHSTINPVMGCNGCELWPIKEKVIRGMMQELRDIKNVPQDVKKTTLRTVLADRQLPAIYRDRKAIAEEICTALDLSAEVRQRVEDVIRQLSKCYAGLPGGFRAGHKRYADQLEIPKIFPGRIAAAAKWKTPTEAEIMEKPWLHGLPRLIFISDTGDALSKSISFEYLRQEVIENVSSPDGQRHIWLWLSKRPGRMAEFGKWLAERGISWPDNLMALTTVTEQRFVPRIDELRKVPSKMRGLSIEPLFEPVILDLEGIDWVTAGGGSDVLADPFHIEWALDLQTQCKAAGVAFFFKQTGKNPKYRGQTLDLADRHGGDWTEWDEAWRIREFPLCFSEYRAERDASFFNNGQIVLNA